MHVITVAAGKFVVDGTSQASLSMTVGVQYTFNQDAVSNNGHPLGFSLNADGSHGHGVEYQDGIIYQLDGVSKTWLTYKAGFNAATQRRLLFTPTLSDQTYYYCAFHSGMGGSAFVAPASGLLAIDGVTQKALSFRQGNIYNFIMDHNSMNSDPVSLSLLPNGQVPYTTVTSPSPCSTTPPRAAARPPSSRCLGMGPIWSLPTAQRPHQGVHPCR